MRAVRPASCAGSVYPADPAALRAALDGWPRPPGGVAAGEVETRLLVAPHIDYRRGARGWAIAYAALSTGADLFVVFGTAHATPPRLFALTRRDHATPLGVVPTDLAVVDAIAGEVGEAEVLRDERAYDREHSIELQLVVLQHRIHRPFTVVPVLCSSLTHLAEPARFTARFLSALGRALQGRRVCFVASADLAHLGPGYGDLRPPRRRRGRPPRGARPGDARLPRDGRRGGLPPRRGAGRPAPPPLRPRPDLRGDEGERHRRPNPPLRALDRRGGLRQLRGGGGVALFGKDMLAGFDAAEVETAGTSIFFRRSGAGPPVLLLHGFPETHLMWRGVAPLLVRRFTVVCADLRGYGRSGCPASAVDHAPYAKRAMAQDMVEVMERLGFRRFSVAGHDRGGRVAYRLALDHPERVERLAVLDVVPTGSAWARADARFALAFWPWSLLAQPEPLPERLVGAAPDAVVDAALGGWGSPAETFEPEVRAAYVEALRDPARVHAICEEYRAAATLDRRHDEEDAKNGRRISCPVLALWSGKGPLASWYAETGGPLALWRAWADDVRGHPLDAGHFFPEELPTEIARELDRFFAPTS